MAPWTKSDRVWHPTSMRFKVQNWGEEKKEKTKDSPPCSLLQSAQFPSLPSHPLYILHYPHCLKSSLSERSHSEIIGWYHQEIDRL